jgi:thiol-disulfide isomerase/thioredoxin
LIAALSAGAAQAAGVAWHGNLQEAVQQAAAQHKPLLVMVKARWCGPCHKMLAQTFPNPAVAARINSSFIPLLIDADEQAALVKSLGIEAMPTVLVISPERKVTGRFTGFQSAAQLDAHLAALTPPPIRRSLPPQFHRWSIPTTTQSLAMRPATAPPAGSSFLRRHAIASLPARPGPFMPGPPRPAALADAMAFGRVDTLTAAKAFSAGGATTVPTVATGPTPNPPD